MKTPAHQIETHDRELSAAGLSDAVDIAALASQARRASRTLATLSTEVKNEVLNRLADLIDSRKMLVLEANAKDVSDARAAGLAEAKLQRLALDDKSLSRISAGIRQVALLPDPVGQVTRDTRVLSGLRVRKVRAPLGVIAMIYEARPGVTVDAFALCFKAGNACILRGGKEAKNCNALLAGLAHEALAASGISEHALVNISGTSREVMQTMLTLDKLIDLVIPRGGHELIELVCSTSRIPTVQHYQGVCHIFVDESAEVDSSVRMCISAKTGSPAACNALECVLVHKNIADRFVPALLEACASAGVKVRCSPLALALAPASAIASETVVPAVASDFGQEFLELTMALRMVASLDEAVDHIAAFGSNHTEAILTADTGPGGSAQQFVRRVQSSCVLVNASTRFNDGFELGLGAEIGISTSRVHAYGPMGLEELTTQRYIVEGNGQTR